MDINILDECKKMSLEGKITFPEVVQRLTTTGVERYMIDLVGMRAFYFGSKDETHFSDFGFVGPKISFDSDPFVVKEALGEILQKKIDYRTFLERIMEAGCTHYTVFIPGRKVIYFGREGVLHIQDF